MKKHVFLQSERYAIWKHYGKHCYWCGEPLSLIEATVDHVIPESLISKPLELVRIRKLFDLPDAFDVNSYENWLPAHDRCNRSKSDKVFKPAPIILDVLRKLEREAARVRIAEASVREIKKVEDILAKLLVAVEVNAIDRKDILAMFADPELKHNCDVKLLEQEFRLHIDPVRWKVMSQNGLVAYVTDGRLNGVTPTSLNPHTSWMCPTCSSHGPWNGMICRNCGQMSDPYD